MNRVVATSVQWDSTTTVPFGIIPFIPAQLTWHRDANSMCVARPFWPTVQLNFCCVLIFCRTIVGIWFFGATGVIKLIAQLSSKVAKHWSSWLTVTPLAWIGLWLEYWFILSKKQQGAWWDWPVGPRSYLSTLRSMNFRVELGVYGLDGLFICDLGSRQWPNNRTSVFKVACNAEYKKTTTKRWNKTLKPRVIDPNQLKMVLDSGVGFLVILLMFRYV